MSFSPDDDEQIIEFVKSNTSLYDIKDHRFRDIHVKDRLWKSLADLLGKDCEYLFHLYLYVQFSHSFNKRIRIISSVFYCKHSDLQSNYLNFNTF